MQPAKHSYAIPHLAIDLNATRRAGQDHGSDHLAGNEDRFDMRCVTGQAMEFRDRNGTDFPVALKGSFDKSVVDPFRPLVEDIRVGDAAGAAHTSGVIRVAVTDFRVKTRDVSGILVHTME